MSYTNTNAIANVVNNTNAIGDTDMTNDNDMMFANDVVITNVVTNGEARMRKLDEMRLAESAVPMVFIEMYFNGFMEDKLQIERQIVSAVIYRTCYHMGSKTVTRSELEEMVYDGAELFGARNRDQIKNYRGSDCNIAEVIEFMQKIKFIDTLANLFFVTDKFWDMTFSAGGAAPLKEGEERRVSYVKNNDSQPSDLMKEAMDFLGDTQFTVDAKMLEAINKVKRELPKLDIWKNTASTLKGCAVMDSDAMYTTEVDADNRGRMYNVAHYGPNAQKDDLNRSLVKLGVGSWTTPDSYEFKFIMEELKDLVKNVPELLSPNALIAMYNKPATSLKRIIEAYPQVKSPFTVVRIAGELGNVIANNGAYTYIPVGLDAKCSGTQIYSILVGDYDMMAACGFSDSKNADPYELTAEKLKAYKLQRADVKTPYMVVQYGGGLKSLMANKDFLAKTPDGVDADVFCKNVIKAVEDTMGESILRLRALIQTQVLKICNARNVESFKYTHIDGFVVNKVVCGTVDITEAYSSIRYQQLEGVIDFGSKLEGKGLVGISDRVPSRDEFARTFAVNYIQGLDALIARTVAVYAKEAGVDGFVSIHDCFRVAPKDVSKLKEIIQKAYSHIFVYNNPLQHLFTQIDLDAQEEGFESVITDDMIYEEDNYFFGL